MKYREKELVNRGLAAYAVDKRLPDSSDLGTGDLPSWRTVYSRYGSMKAYQEAILVKAGSREAMIRAGIFLYKKERRPPVREDLALLPKEYLGVHERDILEEFGTWTDFVQHVCPPIPPVSVRHDLVLVGQILAEVNAVVQKAISETELRQWSSAFGLIPLARKAGRVGMFSRTLAPVLVRIRELQLLGLTIEEVKEYMSVSGQYSNLLKNSCSRCKRPLKGVCLEKSASICTKCAPEIRFKPGETLSQLEVLRRCQQAYPEKPLAISARDLKTWSYGESDQTVRVRSGDEYTYSNRKLIPSVMKVEGRLAYDEAVVPLLIRIRELQLHNACAEDIRRFVRLELYSGLKVSVCRDCGKDLEYLTDRPQNVICDDCGCSVVYNHRKD